MGQLTFAVSRKRDANNLSNYAEATADVKLLQK